MSEISEIGSPNSNKIKNMSSAGNSETSKTAMNPFENTKLKSYNHKANIIPPYVLDRLSQAHYKDQLSNNNVNINQGDINPSMKSIHGKKDPEDEYLSFSNDPFVKSMDSNWNSFLKTIKQPTTYTQDMISYDKETVFENRLEGKWGGEERLKFALLGNPSSDDDTFVNDNKNGFFDKFIHVFNPSSSSSSANKRNPDASPKVRSKAGYWMSDEKRADVLPFLKRIFVINPLVPLLLRVMIIFFSACALGLACVIFQYSNDTYNGYKFEQQPSTIMAITVQSCAIVYVIYIAYDEYSGKPLGLRDPLGKMKLIMLDLLFIIFSSANLSLTFNTLYDDEFVCSTHKVVAGSISIPTVDSICFRQRGLTAFLFLVLCLWVLTFTISIVRVVDRVSVSGQRID